MSKDAPGSCRGSITEHIYEFENGNRKTRRENQRLCKGLILDHLIPEPGAIYVMDRAYLDFQRLYQLHQCSAIFVTRSKTNTGLRRIYSHNVDKNTGVKFDQTVVLKGFYSQKEYPEKLRRIKYFDNEKGRSFIFLTNQFTLPAFTIAALYRHRWRVEIFFKWISSICELRASMERQ